MSYAQTTAAMYWLRPVNAEKRVNGHALRIARAHRRHDASQHTVNKKN